MANSDNNGILRKKAALSAASSGQGGPGADRSWRVVLARAARDAMALQLDVIQLDQSRVSLAELLDLPSDKSMIAVLGGPAEGLGLLAISAPLLAAMTEKQTIGRVAGGGTVPRNPTKTDAVMVAGFIDTALAGLDVALADESDLIWAGGFRYSSFLADPRPLGLLLEDIPYRVLLAEISVEEGTRFGQILMALPSAGRGQRPRSVQHLSPEAVAGHAFSASLAEQIESVHCVLRAVIDRQIRPLSDVMALQVGDILPLPLATVDRVGFVGLDGQQVATGRLGQNRGMRAVRLTGAVKAEAPSPQANGDIVDAQLAATG